MTARTRAAPAVDHDLNKQGQHRLHSAVRDTAADLRGDLHRQPECRRRDLSGRCDDRAVRDVPAGDRADGLLAEAIASQDIMQPVLRSSTVCAPRRSVISSARCSL